MDSTPTVLTSSVVLPVPSDSVRVGGQLRSDQEHFLPGNLQKHEETLTALFKDAVDCKDYTYSCSSRRTKYRVWSDCRKILTRKYKVSGGKPVSMINFQPHVPYGLFWDRTRSPRYETGD